MESYISTNIINSNNTIGDGVTKHVTNIQKEATMTSKNFYEELKAELINRELFFVDKDGSDLYATESTIESINEYGFAVADHYAVIDKFVRFYNWNYELVYTVDTNYCKYEIQPNSNYMYVIVEQGAFSNKPEKTFKVLLTKPRFSDDDIEYIAYIPDYNNTYWHTDDRIWVLKDGTIYRKVDCQEFCKMNDADKYSKDFVSADYKIIPKESWGNNIAMLNVYWHEAFAN